MQIKTHTMMSFEVECTPVEAKELSRDATRILDSIVEESFSSTIKKLLTTLQLLAD